MKTISSILLIYTFFTLTIYAQKSTAMVDSKGHIYYENKIIGKISSAGSLDPSGKSMTTINRDGNIVDTAGKVIGKAPKNNNFPYYISDTEEKYTIEEPTHNGICYVKNKKGETVLLLHQNYKAQAACAIHCLYENHCMPVESKHKH